jgi:hypothetical protein
MTGQPDGWQTGPGDEAGVVRNGLGPPGWAEFSAARERFMRTVAVAGLETAWSAPAREPGEPGRDEGGP